MTLDLKVIDKIPSGGGKTALLQIIVKTQENERKRIARDIHDHLGQEMTGLQLKLGLLFEQCKGDSEVAGKLSELQTMAKKIDSEIDFLAWELRPTVLDSLGLTEAMRQYIAEWARHFNTKVEFDGIGLDERKLTPEVEISLYRIGQEALNNIAKHAAAENVAVLLERRDETILLIIEDDGIGFKPSKKTISTGDDRAMGLLGMKERAELIGGVFDIESCDGGGTTVYVHVPLQSEQYGNRTN